MIHVNWTRWSRWKVLRRKCSTENKRTRQLARFQEWYGWTVVCLGCGERWTDGERHERPFCPGWRKENISNAKNWIRERAA